MIEAAYTGLERVEHGGEAYTGPGAEGDLARALIGQGVDPATPLAFARNGVPALRGTVGAFAGRAWAGQGGDPQFVRWRPHPQGKYPILLMQWHENRPVKGSRGKAAAPGPLEASGGPPGADFRGVSE